MFTQVFAVSIPILIHSNSFLFILIHSNSFLFILIHSYSFLFILLHYSFLFILIHSSSARLANVGAELLVVGSNMDRFLSIDIIFLIHFHNRLCSISKRLELD